MDIKLPDLTIQPGWTTESQLIKIAEELNEVREALARGDIVNVIRESLVQELPSGGRVRVWRDEAEKYWREREDGSDQVVFV